MNKEIRLNAFDMNCVGHIQHGCGRIRAIARPSTIPSNTGRIWRDWWSAASSQRSRTRRRICACGIPSPTRSRRRDAARSSPQTAADRAGVSR